MAEILGHEDGVAAFGPGGKAHRADRWQLGVLEVAEHLVLAPGDLLGQLLERIDEAVDDEEADEVARRADGQLAEPVAGVAPRSQRLLPREIEKAGDLVAEDQAREGHRAGRASGCRVGVRAACAGRR